MKFKYSGLAYRIMNNEAASKIKEMEATIDVHATHFGKNSIKSSKNVLRNKKF